MSEDTSTGFLDALQAMFDLLRKNFTDFTNTL